MEVSANYASCQKAGDIFIARKKKITNYQESCLLVKVIFRNVLMTTKS